MKVLVYGSLNIDLIYSVDHIVAPGETTSSLSLKRSAGGKGANQAAALAKAGMPVFMAGKIGKDGLFLTKLLRSYGVDTQNVLVYEGDSGHAIIQLDNHKQNAIVLHSGGNSAIASHEIETVLAQFDPGDLLVLQNEIACLGEIMEKAKKRGFTISFNPSPYTKNIERLPLELADMLFVNEIEGAALAETALESPADAVMDKLTRRFPNAEIILTLGREGAWYARPGVKAKGTIIDMPVVDTTGAGDTFTGYFIAARCRNYSVEDSLNIACRAASIAVSRLGAMEAVPLASEIF